MLETSGGSKKGGDHDEVCSAGGNDGCEPGAGQGQPGAFTETDFAKVRRTAESGLKSNLFDPGSAQIVYNGGFQWGYAKSLIGKRTWGWIACGTINAKNRMGGYVGAEPFWILSDAAGSVS